VYEATLPVIPVGEVFWIVWTGTIEGCMVCAGNWLLVWEGEDKKYETIISKSTITHPPATIKIFWLEDRLENELRNPFTKQLSIPKL
jgi:hypothetical protein